MTVDLGHVARIRHELWVNGFRPVEVYSLDKRPFGDDWGDRARRDPPEAAVKPPNAVRLNTGILCDGLRAVDVDLDDPRLAAEVIALIESMLPPTIERWRSNAPRVLLPYRAAEGQPPKRQIVGRYGKIEVLGRGQQFLAFGLHPSGVSLQWRPASPVLSRRECLPKVTEEQIGALLDAAAPIIGVTAPAAVVPTTAAAMSEAECDEELIQRVISGVGLHNEMTALSARWIGRGLDASSVTQLLRALMKAVPEEQRDDRWQARFADIERTVDGANTKFAQGARLRKKIARLTHRLADFGCAGMTIKHAIVTEAQRIGLDVGIALYIGGKILTEKMRERRRG